MGTDMDGQVGGQEHYTLYDTLWSDQINYGRFITLSFSYLDGFKTQCVVNNIFQK